MTKLKLGAIEDDKPVKLTIEIPAMTHRNLIAYAEAIGKETGQPLRDPARLITPMIERFMATDRAFGRWKRSRPEKPVSAAKPSSTNQNLKS